MAQNWASNQSTGLRALRSRGNERRCTSKWKREYVLLTSSSSSVSCYSIRYAQHARVNQNETISKRSKCCCEFRMPGVGNTFLLLLVSFVSCLYLCWCCCSLRSDWKPIFPLFESSFNEMIGFNWFFFVFILIENRSGLCLHCRSKIRFAALDWLNDYFVLAQIKFVAHGHFLAREFESVSRAKRLEWWT